MDDSLIKNVLLELKRLPLAKRISLFFIFCFFLGGGLGHFITPDAFVHIMPNYIDARLHLPAVYISGGFEILGALGIVYHVTRQWAGYGLIALVFCVTPANVHMWMHPELFPEIPESMLGARLVMQVLLLLCIRWSTKEQQS